MQSRKLMDPQHLLEQALDKLKSWADILASHAPNAALAVLVMLIFAIAARWVVKALRPAGQRLSNNPQAVNFLLRVTKIAVLALGVFVALKVMNLDGAVASLLAGVGIAGLALGFAFQDLAANFVSGIILAFRRPFQPGDYIESNGFFGEVHTVDLRATVGKSFQGQTVYIPNKQILNDVLTTYDQDGKRRVDLTVGVSYGEDLRKVEKLVVEAVEGLQERDKNQDVTFFYTEYGDSSINFDVRFWIDNPQQSFLKARSDAIVAIKGAFDDASITIPFPIRTIDFSENIGGMELRNALPKLSMSNKGKANASSGTADQDG